MTFSAPPDLSIYVMFLVGIYVGVKLAKSNKKFFNMPKPV